jgi:hypothetical protein
MHAAAPQALLPALRGLLLLLQRGALRVQALQVRVHVAHAALAARLLALRTRTRARTGK